jgi:hypothetical protein
MLQRFAKFLIALLEFLEEPDIFDGDDGLVGEGFQKCDLLVREGTNLRTAYVNRPIAIPSRSSGVTRSVRTPKASR